MERRLKSPPPPPRDPDEAVSGDTSEGSPDSDSDSIASSLDEQWNDDEEFLVEDVLAEGFSRENDRQEWLVSWSGYDIEDATWEPLENLNPQIIETWEATKTRQKDGKADLFDVKSWRKAVRKKWDAKVQSHRRRNEERQKRGHKTTLGCGDEGYPSVPYLGPEGSSDDSEDDGASLILPPKAVSAFKTNRLSDSARTLHGMPPSRTSKPEKPASSKATASVKSPSRQHSLDSQKPTLTTAKPATLLTKKAASAIPTVKGSPTSGTAKPSSIQNTPSAAASTAAAGASSTHPTGMSARPNNTGLMAKRTIPMGSLVVRSSAGNVFARPSGKQRKNRTSLLEKSRDPNQETRAYKNKQTENHVRKLVRSKEDMAPSTIPKGSLFAISKGPNDKASPDSELTMNPLTLGSQRRSSADAQALASTRVSTGENQASSRSILKDASSSRYPTMLPANESRISTPLKREPPDDSWGSLLDNGEQPRRRKSVRFADDDGFVESPEAVNDPMDIDDIDGLFVSRHGHSADETAVAHNTQPNDPPSRKLSLAQYQQSRTQTQPVERLARFGPSGSKSISIAFEDISKDQRHFFLPFSSKEPIAFAHTCQAVDFERELPNLRCGSSNVASGSVSSATAANDLEAVAQRLRLGEFGLAAQSEETAILVYPNKTKGWSSIVHDTDNAAASDSALRYILFKTKGKIFSPEDQLAGTLASPPDRCGHYAKLFGYANEDLWPQFGKTKPAGAITRHLFLAIPSVPAMQAETVKALSLWFKESNPNCIIYQADHEGHWHRFLAALQSEEQRAAGCFILHESQVWNLRHFEKFAEALHVSASTCSFWYLSDGLTQYTMFPSMHPIVERLDICRPRLTGILNGGYAVLVTPSFLVTRPRQAYQFMKWVAKKQGRNFKVVVSAGISDFLESLAKYKYDKRAELLRSTTESTRPPGMEEAVHALTKEHCEAWLKLFGMTRMFLEDSNPSNILEDFEQAEEHFRLVVADESIHPNDEQSLVNWFGAWATTNLDHFRRFFVLGSTFDTASSCYVEVPRYRRDVVGSPEALVIAPNPYEADIKPSNAVRPNGLNMRTVLTDVWGRNRGLHHRVVFSKIPVSYFGSNYLEMSELFQDLRMNYFHPVKEWWARLKPFDRRRTDTRCSYAGFFYTITGEFHPAQPHGPHMPRRHPWLAILRLINNSSQSVNCELIIVDLAFEKKFAGRGEIYEAELMPAQRWLISFIKGNIGNKMPGSALKKVWLAGHVHSKFHPAGHVDGTVELWEAIMKDHEAFLPESAEGLRAARFLLMSHGDARSDFEFSQEDAEIMGMGPGAQQEGKYAVFHPPTGNGRFAKSRCTNALFRAAVEARRKDASCQGFVYSYRPTFEWYQAQKLEGRGLEHLTMLGTNWNTTQELLKMNLTSPDGQK